MHKEEDCLARQALRIAVDLKLSVSPPCHPEKAKGCLRCLGSSSIFETRGV